MYLKTYIIFSRSIIFIISFLPYQSPLYSTPIYISTTSSSSCYSTICPSPKIPPPLIPPVVVHTVPPPVSLSDINKNKYNFLIKIFY